MTRTTRPSSRTYLRIARARALLLRVRGLPLGRKWPHLDQTLGVFLAFLAGHSREGEMGSKLAFATLAEPRGFVSVATTGSMARLQQLIDMGVVDAHFVAHEAAFGTRTCSSG